MHHLSAQWDIERSPQSIKVNFHFESKKPSKLSSTRQIIRFILNYISNIAFYNMKE